MSKHSAWGKGSKWRKTYTINSGYKTIIIKATNEHVLPSCGKVVKKGLRNYMYPYQEEPNTTEGVIYPIRERHGHSSGHIRKSRVSYLNSSSLNETQPMSKKTYRRTLSDGAIVAKRKGLSLKDIEKICSNNYPFDERKIIVLVFARYSLPEVKKMISSNYEYWNTRTEKGVDFYWLGYSYENNPFTNYGNDNPLKHISFDYDVFNEDIKTISQEINKKLSDVTGLLLCNYHDGRVHFKESFYINIEELVQNKENTKLKVYFNELIDLCYKEYDIKQVKNKLISRLKMNATVNASSSTLLSNAMSFVFNTAELVIKIISPLN